MDRIYIYHVLSKVMTRTNVGYLLCLRVGGEFLTDKQFLSKQGKYYDLGGSSNCYSLHTEPPSCHHPSPNNKIKSFCVNCHWRRPQMCKPVQYKHHVIAYTHSPFSWCLYSLPPLFISLVRFCTASAHLGICNNTYFILKLEMTSITQKILL